MPKTLSAYTDIEASSEVMSASGYRLIQLLFEKFLQQINLAKTHLNNDAKLERNNCITKANDIITYLRSCLNFDESTNEFSTQLNLTYVNVQRCLINATLKNDVEYLELASMMITNVKSGWDQIKP